MNKKECIIIKRKNWREIKVFIMMRRVSPVLETHMTDKVNEKTGLLGPINKSGSSSSVGSNKTNKSYGSLVDNCQQAVKSFWNRSRQVWPVPLINKKIVFTIWKIFLKKQIIKPSVIT